MHELPREYFVHWMLLVHGIHLLLSNKVTFAMIETSRHCIDKFVSLVGVRYGIERSITITITTVTCSAPPTNRPKAHYIVHTQIQRSS